MQESKTIIGTTLHQVYHLRNIDAHTYVLRFERSGMQFAAGQYLTAGLPDHIDMREYSIYSSPLEEDYLEILVREIEGGFISKKLRGLRRGDMIRIGGPFGFFLISHDWRELDYVFIATGTGIAPFHCFARTFPDMKYQLIHGIRSEDEQYDVASYAKDRYIHCVSRNAVRGYSGRVTRYVQEHQFPDNALYYLCGNCDMIYEVYDLLRQRSVLPEQLHAEVYF